MNLQELLAKLDTPIVIRPTRRMTQGELEIYLDKAADILRGNAGLEGKSAQPSDQRLSGGRDCRSHA